MNDKCYKCNSTENVRVHYKKTLYTCYICRDCAAEKQRMYFDKCRLEVFEHYGNACKCCGENNLLFLSIDHVNNDGHEELWPGGLRINGRALYQKIRKANYPDKYQLFCMNCNYGKRMNKQVCPHEITKKS